jgi:hypothetical protein
MAQRALRERYDAERRSLDRRAVHYRWWTLKAPRLGPFSALVGLVRGHGLDHGRFVAVYPPEAEPGSEPVLVFQVDDDAIHPAPRGEGEGYLVGELAANGACGLEHGGGVAWPVYNPVPGRRDAPRR